MDPQPPPARRLNFAYGEHVDAVWHPTRPEVACAANAVSLLMPFAEPYIVRSVRAALPEVEDPRLRAEAEGYVRQEASHHAQHRRFNQLLAETQPWVPKLERWVKAWHARLDRRSTTFGVAYATGFETIAYCGARWTDRHLSALFRGADAEPATLFLWHLAEEVEHKTVAHDVYRAIGGTRRTYLAGLLTAFTVLAVFTIAGTLRGLASARKLRSPAVLGRTLKLALSFWFALAPAMAVSLLPSHHPSQLGDPSVLPTWLRGYDERTGTMPADALAVLIG